MTDVKPPAFEIDMGDEPPARPVSERPVTTDQPSDHEREENRRLSASRAQVIEHMRAAQQTQNLVNMDALLLAALCGQGLGAVFKMESWAGWIPLTFLITLAALAWVVWMWRRTLHPILMMASLPFPLDDTAASQSFSLDAAQREQARKRREQDIVNIELCVNELSVLRPRLRSAVRGACWGALCGWIIACMAPTGVPMLAGSAGAGAAATGFWFAAKGDWLFQRIRQVFLLGIPGIVLIVTLACHGPWLWTGVGAVIVVAAGWMYQRKLIALSGLTPVDGIPEVPTTEPTPLSAHEQNESDH